MCLPQTTVDTAVKHTANYSCDRVITGDYVPRPSPPLDHLQHAKQLVLEAIKILRWK